MFLQVSFHCLDGGIKNLNNISMILATNKQQYISAHFLYRNIYALYPSIPMHVVMHY